MKITIAQPKDREIVIEMYLKLLLYVDQFDNDILPIRENAEFMTDTFFMPAAARGEPVLIAWDGTKPVGALFWPVQQLPYKTRWTAAYGYGTYIEDGYRGKKVGTLLREKGIRTLHEKGIQKLVGMVHYKNEISIKASDKMGWTPFARVELSDIKELAKHLPKAT